MTRISPPGICPGYTVTKSTRFCPTEEYFRYRSEFNKRAYEHIPRTFPIHLDLELTNYCNLKCPYCFRQKSTFNEIKKGYMDFKIFKTAIDEGINNGVMAIKLNWRGEATLHPHILNFIGHAKSAGILDIMLNTNGQFSKEFCKQLIEAGVTDISFSIDAFSPETFGKVRVGGDYKTVVNNVLYVRNTIKKERMKRLPNLRATFVLNEHNKDEKDMFFEYWKQRVNIVAINKCHDNSDKDYGIGKRQKKEGFVCPHIFNRLLVTWDGTILPCCGDLYKTMKRGTIGKDTLYDAYNSTFMQRLRKAFISHNYDRFNTCASCVQSYERE